MVYEGNVTSDSYLGGFQLRCRDKRMHEQLTNFVRRETECASEESIDQTKNEDELVSHNNMEIDKRDKEKSEEDDLCVLKDALEAVTSFQGLSQYQKKLMFQNLNNLGAESRKELIDGWKELNVEELHLRTKKLTFFAKFANAGV